ncbi:MAG: hypothetical protein HZA53_06155 [Planctomycetes bacterium]|nr:hypothetical protein [Planctomycetota bacterium]
MASVKFAPSALLLVLAPLARGQSTFTEIEPNETKAQATPVVCLAAGDSITGASQGSSTGLPGPGSADTFRIQTCALPAGLWRHAITITTTVDQYRASIRGRDQSGAPGNGGVPGTNDVELQSTPFLAPRTNTWFGFGRGEELYWRVLGNVNTTAPYVAMLASTGVTPTLVGPLAPGSITITTIGQGHATDTDLWLFDASGRAIPAHGNDDAWPQGVLQSQLTRTLTTGTYLLAVTRYNLANDQPAAADDAYPLGALADFPNLAVQGLFAAAASTNVSFAVSDSIGTVPVNAVLNAGANDPNAIAWFRLEIGTPPLFAPMCAGDGLDPLVTVACPCGNLGLSGRGCANSVHASGALFGASGASNPDTVVLAASALPAAAATIFLQGDALTSAVFGDGVRCAGGTNIRLRTKTASGGVCSFPAAGEPSVSQRGGVTPGSGARRWYQAYYRNSAAAFCPPATFNVTNGWVVDW